jgi:thiol:disulfide interchange protein DsbD
VENVVVDKFDNNFGKEVTYHVSQAVFTAPERIGSNVTGTVPVTVTVSYQTCNDRLCLPPTSTKIPIAIQVTAGSVRDQYRNARLPEESTGLGLFLIAALGAGLLSLVTPCVFPLIPITVTSFVKQADGHKSRLVRIALSFSLGIVALYVTIGLLTSVLLGASGISRLATNPWVNLFAFAVFIVFALSFFETIQIAAPGDIGGWQQSAKKHGGWMGLTALGAVFVLASFTCTAPFIGTLLVAAAGGSIFRPLLGMLTFSLAFVSPFIVLAFFPAWISKIPKSGVWLARVKATLGFVEIAASLKFLSNADLVWQSRIITQSVLLAAWAIIFVCTALYLFGVLKFGIVAETESTGSKPSVVRGALGSAFVLLALYCFWGLSGRPLTPILLAYLPPSSYGNASAAPPSGLPWQSDYQAALAEAKAESKPLLINFTGYTCTNCRYNENQVFPDKKVQQELAKYVLLELYTDGGPDASKNEQLELQKTGDAALPLYAVMDTGSEEVVSKTAGVQTINGFATFLKQSATVETAASVTWRPFTEALVSSGALFGKPTIIDFTANWCTNCKAIEQTVFTDPTIVPELKSFNTFRGDMTDFNSPASLLIEKKYNIGSLPAIVFIGRNGREVPGTRVTGLVSIQQFQQRIQTVLK